MMTDELTQRLRVRAKDWASLPSAAIDLNDAADCIERLRAERDAAYQALEGRLGCGDDDAGKAQKVLWACEAYVLTEDALPGDEFDSEDYSLPKAVAALAAQRDDERDENERPREDVVRLREALQFVHTMARERTSSDLQVHLFDRLGMVEDHAAEALAATDPETRS